ncbi:MAG: ABC transporter substrate-binding protein, partial [Chloroflexota bacterium]|nr:ABC transporter substrate-binding protein [Chloroflexota bacterium]
MNTDQGGAGVTNYLHFDTLYATDRGRNHLASGGYGNWEYVDDNGALLITLQPGIAFHDGEPLDAERLQWWFERNLGRAEYNPDYVSGIGARMSFVGDLQVVDDLSLHVTMDPPNVNAPEQTGGANTLVAPRDYIVEHGDQHFARNPVGFGPYTFVSFTPDQELVSERWDDWFFPNPADEGPFHYYGNWAKTVTARYFPEESGRIAA